MKINCNLKEIAKLFLQRSPEFDANISTITPTHHFGWRNPVITISSTRNGCPLRKHLTFFCSDHFLPSDTI